MSFSRNSEKMKTFITTDSTANIPLNTGNCSFFTNQEIKKKFIQIFIIDHHQYQKARN